MDKRLKDADVSYSSGFLVCRLVGVDESSGESVTVPGVVGRVRCNEIVAYFQTEPKIIELYLRGDEEPVPIVGSLKALDSIMQRDMVRAVD